MLEIKTDFLGEHYDGKKYQPQWRLKLWLKKPMKSGESCAIQHKLRLQKLALCRSQFATGHPMSSKTQRTAALFAPASITTRGIPCWRSRCIMYGTYYKQLQSNTAFLECILGGNEIGDGTPGAWAGAGEWHQDKWTEHLVIDDY